MKQYFLGLLFLAGSVFADVPVPPAASQAEVNAGTLHSKYVAPDTLAGWSGAATNASGWWNTNGTLPLAQLPPQVVTNLPSGANVYWVAPWGNMTNSGSRSAPLDSDQTAINLVGINSTSCVCHFPGTFNVLSNLQISGSITFYNYGATMISISSIPTEVFTIGIVTNNTLYPGQLSILGGTLTQSLSSSIPFWKTINNSASSVPMGTNNSILIQDCSVFSRADAFVMGMGAGGFFIDLEKSTFTSPEDSLLVNGNGISGLIKSCRCVAGQNACLKLGGGNTMWELDDSEFIVPAANLGCPFAITMVSGVHNNAGNSSVIIKNCRVNNNAVLGSDISSPVSSQYGTNTIVFYGLPCPLANMTIGTGTIVSNLDSAGQFFGTFTGNGAGLTNLMFVSTNGAGISFTQPIWTNSAFTHGFYLQVTNGLIVGNPVF